MLRSCHLHAGCHLSSKQFSLKFVPGQRLLPGFDIVSTLSTLHQWFVFTHLHNIYLMHFFFLCTFSLTLTTKALYLCSLRWFEIYPCRSISRGLPSSFMQHRFSAFVAHTHLHNRTLQPKETLNKNTFSQLSSHRD